MNVYDRASYEIGEMFKAIMQANVYYCKVLMMQRKKMHLIE